MIARQSADSSASIFCNLPASTFPHFTTAHKVFVPVSRHFGPTTLRTQDISAPQTDAEVSGQFGTSVKVSFGYFGTGAELSRPR